MRQFPEGSHYLFSYFEYVGGDFEGDMAKIAADPKTQEWWALCKPCQGVPTPPAPTTSFNPPKSRNSSPGMVKSEKCGSTFPASSRVSTARNFTTKSPIYSRKPWS